MVDYIFKQFGTRPPVACSTHTSAANTIHLPLSISQNLNIVSLCNLTYWLIDATYRLLLSIISTYQVLKNEETTVKNWYMPLNSLPTVSSLRYHLNHPLHLKSVPQIIHNLTESQDISKVSNLRLTIHLPSGFFKYFLSILCAI